MTHHIVIVEDFPFNNGNPAIVFLSKDDVTGERLASFVFIGKGELSRQKRCGNYLVVTRLSDPQVWDEVKGLYLDRVNSLMAQINHQQVIQ